MHISQDLTRTFAALGDPTRMAILDRLGAKYETIDLENVSVKLDRSGDYEVLELNIVLPEDNEAKKAPRKVLATT